MGWSLPVRASHSDKKRPFAIKLSGLLLLFLVSQNANATDLQTALTNLSNVIVPMTAMLLVISFCAGIFMIMGAIMQMKKFGMVSQTQHGELGGPLMKMLVGTVLIYLPTSTDTMMSSIFNTSAELFGTGRVNYQNLGVGSTVLGYISADGLSTQWAALANTLVLYIQFLGFLSFIKGWFIMSHSAGQGAQAGSFAKALTHIIGGIIAINFVGVAKIISNTINGTG